MSQVSKEEVNSGGQISQPDYDHMLYVIFHGAIAFYDDPQLPWIDAFVADLKDDHLYVCGRFLGELRIPAGSSMALRGVRAGLKSFDDYKNEILHYPGPGDIGGAKVHLDNVYCRFTFPRPDCILHAFNFTRSDGADPRKLCIVPVFQYRFDSVDDLCLRLFLNYGLGCSVDSGAGQASATPSGVGDDGSSRSDSFSWNPSKCDPTPLTLHIRAEEDRDDPQPGRDHDAAVQILEDTSNTNVQLWDTFDRGDLLPGFDTNRAFWEIDLSLRKRMVWLTAVGRTIQRHPPSPSAPFTITAPPPIKDDDPSCGPDSGGPG